MSWYRIVFTLLIVFSLVNDSKHWNVSLEPIGGSKPQFSSSSTISNYKAGLGSKFALVCPAQAHPLPGFRLVFKKYLEIHIFVSYYFAISIHVHTVYCVVAWFWKKRQTINA